MVNKRVGQTFTRFNAPEATSGVQQCISDIYDKLAAAMQPNTAGLEESIKQLLARLEALENVKATGTPPPGVGPVGPPGPGPGPVIPATSIQGATGRAADPQLPYLAALDELPTDPTYTRDGMLVEYTPDPNTPGLLYRYDEPNAEWVGPMLAAAITDQHHVRIDDWDPTTLDVGAMFYETDRTVLYIVQNVSSDLVWVYATGMMETVAADQPDDLGVNDAGFRWKNIDTQYTYRWNGLIWQLEPEIGLAIRVPHSLRVATGTCGVESPLGTVDTAGTLVSRVSGTLFDTTIGAWDGLTIQINGVDYIIVSVISSSSLTITTSAGVQSGVVYGLYAALVDKIVGEDFLETWVGLNIAIGNTITEVLFVDFALQTLYVSGVFVTDPATTYSLTEYASINYRNGVTLYESDRHTVYVAGDFTDQCDTTELTGSVDTNLTGVTLTGGDSFIANGSWDGLEIVIDGSTYVIDTVIDANNLILTTSAGVLSAVPYSMPTVWRATLLSAIDVDPAWTPGADVVIDGIACVISAIELPNILYVIGSLTVLTAVDISVSSGAWIYQSGIYCDDWVDMPTDLGPYDVGFLFASRDYQHTHEWNGSVWDFAVGDPGSGFIVDAIDVPNGGAASWGACDGSAYAVMLGDGTTVSVTSPNWNGTNAFEQASGTNPVGIYVDATAPQWETGAKTDVNNTGHTHEVDRGSVAVDTGAGDAGNSGVTTTGPESNTHYHELNDTDAPLKAPGEANGGLPGRIPFLKYLRR